MPEEGSGATQFVRTRTDQVKAAGLPLERTKVRVAGEYGMLLATAVGLIVLSVLSAWWPARRAARLDIVEALRHA